MIIPFLDNFEIPDSLIQEWDEVNSDDPRHIEKQAIDYIKDHTDFQYSIGALWNGAQVILTFGYNPEFEEEGFYYA